MIPIRRTSSGVSSRTKGNMTPVYCHDCGKQIKVTQGRSGNYGLQAVCGKCRSK